MKPDANDLTETTKSPLDDAAKPSEVLEGQNIEPAAHDRRAALRRGVCAERFVSPAKSPKKTQKEWSEFILSVAGSIPDPSFRRHDQGTFEQRDELR